MTPYPASAVQEERQRGKDRGESEVESSSSANEDMPVEKILEAELAVEPKTETYVEANVGLNPSSVSAPAHVHLLCSGDGGPGSMPGRGPCHHTPAWRGTLSPPVPLPLREALLPVRWASFLLLGSKPRTLQLPSSFLLPLAHRAARPVGSTGCQHDLCLPCGFRAALGSPWLLSSVLSLPHVARTPRPLPPQGPCSCGLHRSSSGFSLAKCAFLGEPFPSRLPCSPFMGARRP